MTTITLILNADNDFIIEGDRLYSKDKSMFSYEKNGNFFTVTEPFVAHKNNRSMFLPYTDRITTESPLCDLIMDSTDFEEPAKVNSIKFPDVMISSIVNIKKSNLCILDNVLI